MPHRRASILVIDDDSAIRDLTAQTLRDEGYFAVTLTDHSEAVRYLAAFRFDLVLADSAGAGVADHWAALEKVRAAAGDTPILVFSAHDPAVFADYVERGFAGVIAKPFDLDGLLAAVCDTLAGRRPASAE
jgi:CheY-like chemotaxis protein